MQTRIGTTTYYKFTGKYFAIKFVITGLALVGEILARWQPYK